MSDNEDHVVSFAWNLTHSAKRLRLKVSPDVTQMNGDDLLGTTFQVTARVRGEECLLADVEVSDDGVSVADGFLDNLLSVTWDDRRHSEKVVRVLRSQKERARKAKRWLVHTAIADDPTDEELERNGQIRETRDRALAALIETVEEHVKHAGGSLTKALSRLTEGMPEDELLRAKYRVTRTWD